MLTKILSFLLTVLSLLTFDPLSNYDYSDRLGDENYKGLKEYYADYFDIGAAVAGWHCQNSGYADFILKNYSSLTAENAFKQPAINPSEGVWNFAEADAIANFCRENGLKLRGHCLVWGGLGSWMSRDSAGELVSKEVYYERLRGYLSVIMPRYADIVSVWDVVNEPFGYDRKDGEFKDNDLYRICGEEYITKAFEIAHEVDPSAKLCLNECKVVNNSTKQKYLLKYLEKWIDEGVPIHAVGIQGHWSTFEINESPRRLQKVIDKLYGLGVDIQITEIDMEITADKSEVFDTVPKNTVLLQSKKYSQMFGVLRKNSDKISSVTFWGVSDNRPFTAEDGSKHYPSQLLFDKDNMPKNAFYAVCDFDTADGVNPDVHGAECNEAARSVTAEFVKKESVEVTSPVPVFAPDMPDAQVITVNGMSRLSVNGQLISPVLFFGNTDFPNPNGVTTSQAGLAADAGIHLHSIIENLNYYADPETLSEPEIKVFYAHLRESVKSITDADPEAKILLRVKVTMPQADLTPESEIIQYKNKSIDSGVVSMASDLFNKESCKRLAHLVDYVSADGDLAKHVIGYHLENNEWFQYQYRENGQDFSRANNEKFVQWLRVKYKTDEALQKAWGSCFVKLGSVSIPQNLPGNIYDNGNLYDDILFYGTKTQKYIDYHQYICDLTAARISNLARIVKERTDRRAIVISFYGYHFELFSSLSGHHNLNWLLSDENIDGFAGPVSYRDRNYSAYTPNSPVGAAGAYMSTVDSIQRSGKIWFQESDERTFINHTDEPYEDTFLPPIESVSDIIEVHKRELGDAILHGSGMWAMDLWARGWLDDPAIWENLAKLSDLYRAYQDGCGQASRFDTALVVDEYSLHRMANQGPVGDELLGEMQLNLYHAGLSTCYVQLKDVLAGRVDDAKLYIITSAFDLTDGQIKQLRTALHKDGKTAVFMYNFGDMTAEQAGALTGMDFRVNKKVSRTRMKMVKQSTVPGLLEDGHSAPISRAMSVVGGQTETLGTYSDGSVGFAIKKQDDFTTVYCGDSLISVENLRALVRACGIHVYSESGDVLTANQNLVVFHAVNAGEKTVSFEEKTDVWDYFNNKWYTGVDSVTFSAGVGETRYLFFGSKEQIEKWNLPLYK